MKILMTGMTPVQVGGGNRMKIMSSSLLLPRALELAGHDVDFRSPEPNDDLTPYDVVLVGLVGPFSINAAHLYPAFDTIWQCKQQGKPLGFTISDWQFFKIKSNAASAARDLNRLYRLDGRRHKEWGNSEEGKQITGLVSWAIGNRPWPTTILPTFPWGDRSKLTKYVPTERVRFVDPTGLATYVRHVIPPEEKRHEWVLGTITQMARNRPGRWLEELRTTWPIARFGTSSSGADQKLTEPELVEYVANCWGSLSPPHNHAGSGWWRCRMIYTAAVRSIFIGDQAEVEALGPAYDVTPDAVEGLSSAGRRDLAEYQADALRARVWPRDRLISEMDAIVRGIKEET